MPRQPPQLWRTPGISTRPPALITLNSRRHHRAHRTVTAAGPRDGALTVSYLDDPEHPWLLDPATLHGVVDAEQILADLLQRELSGGDLMLIYRGARGLWERGQGSATQCLDTSMVWLFG